MESRIEESNGKYLYRTLCVLAMAVALLPVGCNYIMSGGIVTEWIARMDEIARGISEGQVYLFPSVEVLVSTGITVNGMNSNLWFILPGLLHRLLGNIVLVYRIYMLGIQLGTLMGAVLFFERVFAKEKTKLPACLGILLYMTCPYRIYVCYDWANLSQAVAWMLLPLYAWAVMGIVGQKRNRGAVLIAAPVLAGIGYADVVFFMILVGITLLTGVLYRKPWLLAPAAVGSALFLPGLYRLIQYLFLNHYQELNMPIQSIMKRGYRFGEFFSTYAYKEGHPGMGLGMMICLLTGMWLWFVQGKKEKSCACRYFSRVSIICMIFSFYYFPWDIFQRLGGWSLKLISLLETPAVFAGLAFGGLCIPAAYGVHQISKHENKVIAYAIPVMVAVACVGVCLYQCNTLTYSRVPLVLP